MGTERQIEMLELLDVSPEHVPADATANDLRRVIANRIRQLMHMFPPGSFVTIRSGKIHLIKSYQGDRDKPTAFISECEGVQYNPNIEELGKATLVEGPADPDVQVKAAFFRERHEFSVAIQTALERIARSDRYGMLNFSTLPLIARRLIDKTWPVKKTDMQPPEVDDMMITDFLEEWMQKEGIRLV